MIGIWLAILMTFDGFCSSSYADSSSRIVNGIAADISQFPYAISLQELSQLAQTNRGHSCGGTLVTYQHVLTSGSCLYVQNAQGVYALKSPALYRVFAGATLLTNDTSVDRVRGVSSFLPHPNYTGPPSSHHDIGIIIVATAFPNTTVTPIPISSAAAASPAEFSDCLSAGWGASAYGAVTVNTALYSANKYIYSQTMCMVVLNPQPSAPNVLPLHLCAASYSLSASCTNDTGNALTCGGVLAGVLSWHPTCGAETSWPDVYTRTANYSDWVRSITGDATRTSPALTILIFFTIVFSTIILQ